MGKRKAHRAYAGGRKRFFRKMMRELHAFGDFDPSAFPPPRLSPLPSPVEVEEALNTHDRSRPDLSEGEPPEEPSVNPSAVKPNDSETSRPDPAATPNNAVSSFKRRRPARGTVDFAPARIMTRPLPLSIAARKPMKYPAAISRRLPTIVGDIKIRLTITKNRHGNIRFTRSQLM
ncbi:histone-lysine N-methyltransferase SETD1A-like [Solenopsis invicta]|uniref:histone-lysine N-methyltransferase SETD1A-like n=1 Tax=Solenopsis invicta TaxID=13686 RepID=UPI00193E3C5B|nr:histone-lysine N-methyltransferase SETD1A-like [Solenopsis invicta]